jgi:hypothetical protein
MSNKWFREVERRLERSVDQFSSNLFRYKDKQFTAFASDLGMMAYPSVIWIVSARTGKKLQFKIVRQERDREGELQWTEYIATDLKVKIWND